MLLYPIFKIDTTAFKECRIGKLLRQYTSDFKYEIGQVIKDNKRNLTIIDKKKVQEERIDEKGYKIIVNLKYYKYHCNECGFYCGEHFKNQEHKEEYWVAENNLTKGTGCPVCGSTSKIVVNGINDIFTTNPELVKYFVNIEDIYKYSYGSNKDKVRFKCPDCGFEKEITVSDLYWWGFSCPRCGDGISYPEKFMFNILEQLKIAFKNEYNPEWCKFKCKDKIKQGYYDFYFKLNNKEYIIEMDGGFHSKDNKINGQTAKEAQFIDNEKDRLAEEYGIEVIRIDCSYEHNDKFEYIKQNILNDYILDTLFSFNKVNWNIANEFATSNLVKTACEYKKNNPDMTSNDIGNIMKFSAKTIIIYLKKGTLLNWCYYNAKEESIKSGVIQGKRNGKPVEIFKEGISKGIFPSCSELERKSLELFGEKLNFGKISLVCLGKQKEYKGYTFKYVA